MTNLLLLAAESAQPMDFNWVPHVTAIIVFLVAFGVLKAKVWPSITKALDEREAKILNEIKSAEDARRSAESARMEFERKLAEGRQEAAAMISRAKEDAQAVANELRARNEAELADLRLRAQRDIGAAKQAAVAELHAQAANLASLMASKILKREISVPDQQRLMEESLRELQSSRN
jgi:F-type H+-transporting ATPase subunit b